MAGVTMSCYFNDSDLSQLQRLLGASATPRKVNKGENYNWERMLSATQGCPCDACQWRPKCQVECHPFRVWQSRGVVAPSRRRKRRAA